MTRKSKLIFAIIGTGVLVLATVGYQRLRNRLWTANELRGWYSHLDTRRSFLGPLHYRGSDEEFHYFVVLSMDSWVFPKVRRDEIALDVRPRLAASGEPFPGYYTVDPLHEFRKVETTAR